MQLVALFALLHAVAAVNLGTSSSESLLETALVPAPAPAGAPAQAPSGPQALETLQITFQIQNFNYYELTKQTCPEKYIKKSVAKLVNKPKKPVQKEAETAEEPEDGGDDTAEPVTEDGPGVLPAPPPGVPKEPTPADPKPAGDSDVQSAMEEVHENANDIANQVEDSVGGKDQSSGLPWMEGKKQKYNLLQIGTCAVREDIGETTSKECTTIADVLRDAITETVRGIIKCLWEQSLTAGPAPGPAPMPSLPEGLSPGAFLEAKPSKAKKSKGPAPAPALAPAPADFGPPIPQIFVTFSPGPERKAPHKKVSLLSLPPHTPAPTPRSTIVEITFLDTPENAVDDVAAAKPFLEWALSSGMFDQKLEEALQKLTRIPPKIKKVKIDHKHKIEQWDINKCETHIKDIVNEFSHHYTRRQVPVALYNECTNFMTKMSFSHDYVLDPMDTVRCRRATRKFAEKWNHGSNAKEKDFEKMCFHACEAKYGRNAPTCNLHAGDKLLKQPQL